ncbi:hypothetical protein [Paraburkholderia sp. BCC1884]|uniref:hypothetical protein n=1 Tax=Paraburkholderia sp. BCC1884 TaxID=2562668 RepID=UPI001642A7DB|nr:hypothetical protein [Paraburkholderia sp. BCC1884]
MVKASEKAVKGPDNPAMLGENDMLSASGLTDIVSPRPRSCWPAVRPPCAARSSIRERAFPGFQNLADAAAKRIGMATGLQPDFLQPD